MAPLKIKTLVRHHRDLAPRNFSFTDINKLVVHSVDCTRIIPTDKIEFIEASGGYSIIHFTDATTLLVSKTLKYISTSLGACFLRIHNSYVINLNYMKEYRPKESQVTMESSKTAQVSRVKKQILKEILKAQ